MELQAQYIKNLTHSTNYSLLYAFEPHKRRTLGLLASDKLRQTKRLNYLCVQ